ncbi:hypothetical protein K5D40_22605, partial [Pseudomonas cichorii]|nr:hypothetical protein [Pseudomonas cichorii]
LDSVVKERWVEPFVSTEARILQRPLHLSSGYFNKFQSFLCNFNHLRFDQRRVARQREANSTGPEGCVKRFLTPLSIQHRSKHFQHDSRTAKHLQTIDLQGFFSSVCAGSGANYREIKSPVNR